MEQDMKRDTGHLQLFQERIRCRKGILGCGEDYTVAVGDDGTLRYTGSDRWGQGRAASWRDIAALCCALDYVVGLRRDGTVVAAGQDTHGRLDVDSWACVRTVACSPTHTAACLLDGGVVCTGNGSRAYEHTDGWKDMTDVACGHGFTVGLDSHGGVRMAGGTRRLRERIKRWREVAGLFTDAAGRQVYAVTEQGTLLSTQRLPRRVKRWENLVYVAADGRRLMGITAAGELLRTDGHRHGRRGRTASTGTDHIAVAVGNGHTAVLQKNGTVAAVGDDRYGQCQTEGWKPLFAAFDGFSARRRDQAKAQAAFETLYDQRVAAAERFGRRMACGARLTACITAGGHVNVTAPFTGVKSWEDVKAVSCGSAHVLALHGDGSVSADGNDVQGCCFVSHWKNVTDVLAGKYHSLGLTEDGHVLFAGWNLHGQGNVEIWENIILLRGTDTFTVGMDRQGKLTVAGERLPFDPEKLQGDAWRDLVDISVSAHHIAGLRRDGRVVFLGDICCGDPAALQAEIGRWRGVRAIASGNGYVVGLCDGGHVVAAGRDHLGQCRTESWRRVVAVQCGRAHTVGLLTDGTVVSAGMQKCREVPDRYDPHVGEPLIAKEKSESLAYEPCHTDTWTDVMAIACGQHHVVAMDKHGHMLASGLDRDGQCTAAAAFTPLRDIRQSENHGRYTAVRPEGASGEEGVPAAERRDPSVDDTPVAVARTLGRAVYITADGRVISVDGEGEHTVTSQLATDARAVACGLDHVAVLLRDGRLLAMGRDTHGQCRAEELNRELSGMGSRDPAGGFRTVACGYEHTVAVRGDGRVYAVGQNQYGQCDTRDWRGIHAVACGVRHTVGLAEDGTAVAVGDDRYGQCNVRHWHDVCAVACGEFHTVALQSDGRVMAVGDDRLGQCRVEDLEDVVGIACLPDATLCVHGDGHVSLRGGTGAYDGAVAALENVAAVACCELHITALTRDGRVLQVC